MKKQLFYLPLFLLMFLFVPKVNALTLKDGSQLTNSNIDTFVKELGYDYWHDNIGSDYFAIVPGKYLNSYSEFLIVKSDKPLVEKGNNYDNYFSCTDSLCRSLKVKYSDSSIDFTKDYFSSVSVSVGFDYTKVMSTFSLMKNGSTSYLFESNFNNVAYYFDVVFDIPDGSTIIVKDSKDNIITSSNYSYSLVAGEYKYSLINDLYESLDDVSFIVSENMTIKPNLKSKLQTKNFDSIIEKFYINLKNMISILFDFKNPLFYFLIGILIFISILLLLKRILGGRF